MKQKKYFILAAAAALFAACSSDDATIEQAQKQQAPQEVSFSAYVNRGTTRAGATGELTTAMLTSTTGGFGVFAYYTDAEEYDNLSSMPNFMYNQQVTSNGAATPQFSYSPIKYWPNEFGDNALADNTDRLSFFAYAPYVAVTPTTGKVSTTNATPKEDTWGIVGMKRNNESGDPMIKYISSFYTDKQVDLLWGTVSSDKTSWALKNTGNQTLTEGMPWLNIQHPSATSKTWTDAQKVKFQFEHALAAMVVTVDTYADLTTPTTTSSTGKDPAAGTKVYIRSVTFEGFDTQGALNLNNEVAKTPLWCDFDCMCEQKDGGEVTIKDGRKDGIEGTTPAPKENAMINPNFVQSTVWDNASPMPGVTGTAANLFRTSANAAPAADAPIFVIPNGDQLKVTIEYDVLTADGNLAGKLNDGKTSGSVVKNVISRYITFSNNEAGDVSAGTALVNGKKYTIKLHLGLNSVQFDAAVTTWNTENTTGGADLPHNN